MRKTGGPSNQLSGWQAPNSRRANAVDLYEAPQDRIVYGEAKGFTDLMEQDEAGLVLAANVAPQLQRGVAFDAVVNVAMAAKMLRTSILCEWTMVPDMSENCL